MEEAAGDDARGRCFRDTGFKRIARYVLIIAASVS